MGNRLLSKAERIVTCSLILPPEYAPCTGDYGNSKVVVLLGSVEVVHDKNFDATLRTSAPLKNTPVVRSEPKASLLTPHVYPTCFFRLIFLAANGRCVGRPGDFEGELFRYLVGTGADARVVNNLTCIVTLLKRA